MAGSPRVIYGVRRMNFINGATRSWLITWFDICFPSTKFLGIEERRWLMEVDFGRWMVWNLSEMTGGPLPPYLLEIVMRDGRSFYVHSGNSRDEESNSVVVNVWDLRAVDKNAEAEIKKILDQPKVWDNVQSKQPSDLYPSLSIGRLRCALDDILYVVEWWTRYWGMEKFFPEETVQKMGFKTPQGKRI